MLPYKLLIVAPDGREYESNRAPCFKTFEEAVDEAVYTSWMLEQAGEAGHVIVRDLRTGEVVSALGASPEDAAQALLSSQG